MQRGEFEYASTTTNANGDRVRHFNRVGDREAQPTCNTIGCVVRQFVSVGETTKVMLGVMAATMVACVYIDRMGYQNSRCCRRPRTKEEIMVRTPLSACACTHP